MGTVPLGTRSTVRRAVRRGIGVTATEWSKTCNGVHARCRRGLTAAQDIMVGIVKRKQTRFLDSFLREHRRCEHQRQHGCRAEDLESVHSLLSPCIDWYEKPIVLGSSRLRIQLSTSPAGWRATGSISASSIGTISFPRDQTVFAMKLFGDRRA